MDDRQYQIITITKLVLTLTTLCFLLHTAYIVRTSIQKLTCNPRDQSCSIDFSEDGNFVTSLQSQSARPKFLIFSLPRSGSSFFGEIFNREEDVFYLYEPLHANEALSNLPIVRPRSIADESSVRKLNDLYECTLRRHEYLFRFISYPEFSNPHFRLMSRVLASPPFCDYVVLSNSTETDYKRYCHPIDTSILANVCQRKSAIVIKELMHRLPLDNPREMTSLFQIQNLKSIWLVRDPRAIIASMISMGWIAESSMQTFDQVLESTISRVCGLYERFLLTLSFISVEARRNFNVLRYEDLVTQPRDVILRIIQISYRHISDESLEWVLQNTQGSSTAVNSEDSYSVVGRNASYSLTSWRKRLGLSHVLSIQNKCGNFMTRLGYTYFFEERHLVDLKYPSYRTLSSL